MCARTSKRGTIMGNVTHANATRVMGTLVEPRSAYFPYEVGQYVYVHTHADEHNPLDAQECVIVNVDHAPLEIVVQPCNHPELTHTVAQDKLSAPIAV
jgi:hypothetical protein